MKLEKFDIGVYFVGTILIHIWISFPSSDSPHTRTANTVVVVLGLIIYTLYKIGGAIIKAIENKK